MSSQDENVEVVRRGMEAFQRGDLEEFLAFLDPEVQVISPAELPNPAHTTGRDGYLEWVGRWLDAWESFEVEPKQFEPVGDRHVLIDVVELAVGKGSGVAVDMPMTYMVEVEDGLATRLHLYADRAQALAAARAGEEDAASAP